MSRAVEGPCSFVAPAAEQHQAGSFGDDFGTVALLAVLAFPAACLQAAFHVDLRAFGQILRDVLAAGSEAEGRGSKELRNDSAERTPSLSRVSFAAAKASASTKRFVSSAEDGDEPRVVTNGRSVPFEVRRDPPPHARSPKPAPTETGAFIDFYSGVLGVDRAQLARER